jgi:cytochrome c6
MSRTGSAIALAVAALLAALAIAGCGGDDDGDETATAGAPQEPAEEQPLNPAEERGRNLFVENCGSCHTLDAAGTQGQIGPNLGDIPLDASDVLSAIRNGGRGSGNMPPNLVRGKDAADVALFVANSGP